MSGYQIVDLAIVAYVVAIFGMLYWVWRRPRSTYTKGWTSVLVLGLSGALPMAWVKESEGRRQLEQEAAEYRTAAWAHFRKRCKESARETIVETINGVEGIYLQKPRSAPTQKQLRDQYWMGDPYGYSNYEALYPIGTYLFDRSGKTITRIRFSPIGGYRYVEVEISDNRSSEFRYLRYRLEDVMVPNTVTGTLEPRREPRATATEDLLSKFGVTWEDISTPEDRKYWVAGGRLTVFEIKTKKVLGERIGYVIEPGFGDTSHGRRPWLAVGRTKSAFCPQFENYSHKNKEFVAKVLRSSREIDDAQ